ncbi:hypothetical protein L861_15145 [Litchfieldella anticariensis FP35 = DSM 16096]|uniref:Sulfatase N-terminal domain-containing protein n=1 Tax=Litchfieldella anticariensis (strain DSM 16096 / CECT 5854 / CIP 108499 / LMG 22089 / FP35) TaxID=1121939 RepID=S2KKA0_LITA3|nr:DUF3413 domain-containing protein [Halomonas anticariensis]EPC02370.1 hypothetical protein L861_15145 [Halomonas anticariensis FP35 = DSM 16096]
MRVVNLLSWFRATEPDTTKRRLGWTAWFVFANVPVAWLIAIRFLNWMPVPDATTGLYVGLVYIAQFTLLTWVPGLFLLALALIMPRRWLILVSIIVVTLAQALLITDTLFYSLYRYHLSGFMFEAFVKAGDHTFQFSWQIWLTAAITLFTLSLVEATIAIGLTRKRPRVRWLGAAFVAFFSTQLAAHSWHAWADATYDTRITSLTRHVPLYYPATANRFLHGQGWVRAQASRKENQVRELTSFRTGDGLNYPTRPLACQPPQTRPNVLMIAVDTLRADMLDPRWMPNVSEFADETSQIFTDHYSGGNSTKAGGFSLFYGLPPTYWDIFETTQTPPAWIARLQELNYETKILSAGTLISPALHRTAFASIDGIRLTPPGEEAWQRDQLITNDWLNFTAQRGADAKPFFGFLFYMSVHGYSVPPDFPRIEPYWETINHLALDQEFDPTPYFNRYKTATRYVDQLIGRVLNDLKQRKLLNNTIVILTSDHGEEFNDNGKNYWGHGSNYSDAQLKVPMVLYWPGKPPARITQRTSHADIPPTLMQSALGCPRTPASAYSIGSNLFIPDNKEWMIAGSYTNYAIVTKKQLVVTYPTGQYEVVDKFLGPSESRFLSESTLKDSHEALSRFYNKNR